MTEKRRLNECFQKGERLANRERNHDYAHEMFATCVTACPGNLAYTEAMFANLRAKFGNDRQKAAHIFRLPGTRELSKAVADGDWSNVIQLGLGLLISDPWDVPTLRNMAVACQHLHHNETELVYLKQALDAAPRDVDVNRHCAHSLGRMGQFDQAIACWHRVEEIRGGDPEAAQMILRLTQEKMQYPGGRSVEKAKTTTNSTTRDIETDEGEDDCAAESIISPAESVPLSETPRQRLERLIRTDPADVLHYIELAEWLCEQMQYDDAERVLGRAQENCAQEHLIRRALDQVVYQRASANSARSAESPVDRGKAARRLGEFPWLESLLVVTGGALVVQLVPGWSEFLIAHLQASLIVLNVIVIFVLVFWQIRARSH